MEYEVNEIVTDQFRMEYLCFGKGKKPFVILPGLSVQSMIRSAPAIVGQYRRFTDDFTVYFFDRRADLPSDYDVAQMAHDTTQAFEKLELTEISLFGVSQGGMISLTIAADHPEMISRLAVCSTLMRMTQKRFHVIREWVELARKKDREGLYLSIGEHIYPGKMYERFKDALVGFSKTVTDEELARFIILANGMHGFDLTGKIGQIRCPVQVTFDEEDTVLDAEAASELAAHLSCLDGFEMRHFNGCGHALYDTAPGFREWLYHFVTEKRER